MLRIEQIHVSYGKSHVLHDVSLELQPGTITCLIGRNGMGKTTLLKSTIGLLHPHSGKITLEGQDVTRLKPHQRAQMGIAYIPQGREIIPQFTVEENLLLGLFARRPGNRLRYVPTEIFEFFPMLKEHLHRKGGVLSGGQQQQLAIARGLISEPMLMILDEPSEGIQPNIVQEIEAILKRIQEKKKVTMLLVEQNLDVATALGEWFHIMENGTIVANGSMTQLTDDVIHRYLVI